MLSHNLRQNDVCPTPVQVAEMWSRMISAKSVEPDLLRHEIATSWQRCLALKVNPYDITDSPNFLASAEIMEENSLLLNVAKPHMLRLFSLLQGRGFIVMLMNPEGYIVSLFGDKKMSSYAESMNVYPGVNNAEWSIGTTAPGISLIEGATLQVLKHEHYCQLYHGWCCSSAPIKNADGSIIGALNVSNIHLERHPRELLGLVQMAAMGVQGEMQYRLLKTEFSRKNFYFQAIVDNSSEAFFIIDTRDKFSHISSKAVKLLGVSERELLGQDAQDAIANFVFAREDLHAGKQWTELHFVRPKKISVDAQLKLLQAKGLEPLGIMGVLKKKQVSALGGLEAGYGFRDFIFQSSITAQLVNDAIRLAATDHTILIQGESGTGKEVLAQAMHRRSSRRSMPFVAVNCAALPRELIQSELFGYESGSFTGASKGGKPGKFELAQGGTILLDEIGDMPFEAQANLLRVLQEKSVVRIGGSAPKKLDVRILVATNKNLLDEVAAGRFRNDLYYRLSVINLTIPPLRERREDIRPLISHFVSAGGGNALGAGGISFTPQAKAALMSYDWPGNVRELQNAVTFFLTHMKNATVSIAELPEHITGAAMAFPKMDDLKAVEKKTIQAALYKCGGHISNTARMLGISRATLYRKLKSFELLEPE